MVNGLVIGLIVGWIVGGFFVHVIWMREVTKKIQDVYERATGHRPSVNEVQAMVVTELKAARKR